MEGPDGWNTVWSEGEVMDQETIRYFDDGDPGDWVRVEYWMGMDTTVMEGEFYGFGRTRRGNWYMHIRGLILIPTCDIRSIRVLIPAGCL